MLEFIGGLLMSLGGSVPGVSGGTIAFLMGFFDEMLNSVNTFLSKKSTQKKKSFFFLLRLVGGYLLGLALATFLIKRFFAEHIYPVSSLFLGVTLFSVPLIVKEEFGTLKGKFKEALWILPGVAAIVGLTLLSESGIFNASSQWAQIVLAVPAGIFVSCALIMPGVSGAAFLYIFGLYEKFYNSLSSLAHLDFSVVPFLLSMGLGAVIGILVVVKGVRFLLNKHRCPTIYAILGMMLGSMYSIWIGPSKLDTPQPILDFSSFSIWFFLLGGLFIALFELSKILVRKKQQK